MKKKKTWNLSDPDPVVRKELRIVFGYTRFFVFREENAVVKTEDSMEWDGVRFMIGFLEPARGKRAVAFTPRLALSPEDAYRHLLDDIVSRLEVSSLEEAELKLESMGF